MNYAFWSVWTQRSRYLPAVAAIAFSAILTAMEVGIFLGFLEVVGSPISISSADIWIMYPQTPSISTARSIPSYWSDVVWSQPSVTGVDEYVQGIALWTTKTGLNELVVVMGCTTEEGSLGPVGLLSKEQRRKLAVNGNVILDRRDCRRVEIDAANQTGEVGGHVVRVVDFVADLRGVAGPYVLCSRDTARDLLHMPRDQSTFLLARCDDPLQVDSTVAAIDRLGPFDAQSASEFINSSKWYWFTKTKAGIAIAFAALLGLTLGASVTSQVLYTAIASTFRELAVLRALGVPRFRIARYILQMTFLVAVAGLAFALPATFAVAEIARIFGTVSLLPTWLLVGTSLLVLSMAIFSSTVALRALWRLEPVTLLR